MAQQDDFQIVRMTGMYGDCRAIKAVRNFETIGRAVLIGGVPGRGSVWYIGPEGFPGADRFDVEVDARDFRHLEDMLAHVELMLRLAVSAADLRVEAA